MAAYEIPLTPQAQTITARLAGTNYMLRFYYTSAPDSGWVLDISDAKGNPLVCGIPLVTGADLLAQYAYVGIAGKLFVMTSGDPGAVPTFDNLGVSSHLYFEANQ